MRKTLGQVLQISLRIFNGHKHHIRLCGELDVQTAAHVVEIAQQLISSGPTHVDIDCADLSFVDSGGLSALVRIHTLTCEAGGRVRLLSPTDRLRDMLGITGLMQVMDVVAAEQDQVMSIAGNDDRLILRRTVFHARPRAVADVRRDAVQYAGEMSFTERQVEDIRLAVGEAVSNAVKHGSPQRESNYVTIQYEYAEDGCVVTVSDEGGGFDPEAVPCCMPNCMFEGGRGLHVMRALMDSVSFSFGKGTTVRLMIRIREDAGPPSDV